MGVLDHLSDYFTIDRPRKKRKAMQTVEIKVKMDCDGCERRVKNAVTSMKGIPTLYFLYPLTPYTSLYVHIRLYIT
uniref:HMA domain-containing protein n=1 Tax=Cannabis sativa TaxID=3483 RepID=A0A803QZD9_CANSA